MLLVRMKRRWGRLGDVATARSACAYWLAFRNLAKKATDTDWNQKLTRVSAIEMTGRGVRHLQGCR